MSEQEPKKRVDEAWKEKVEAEKEQKGEQAAGKDKPADQEPQTKAPPAKVDFSVFLASIAGQALISLGQVENPITKKRETDLQQAKNSIDLLQVLKDKTKGNLTEQEQKYLNSLLYDLRMRYVAANR